ncbi:hypothetical protein GCM10008119_07190 [Pedobacter mendelii]|uniref:Uncharacterized protein n=1 Tax=Pedobacter mendelii TaxID=1908240 RepID=A0ABQ2BGI8_9SPHI|nr:hypothetical protein GCM10008119_07190 [Pedobacter mendelii]
MKFLKNSKPDRNNDEVAQRIAERITSRQQRIANYLNDRTKDVSGKYLLISLIAFCTVFASYLLYLLINAVN